MDQDLFWNGIWAKLQQAFEVYSKEEEKKRINTSN